MKKVVPIGLFALLLYHTLAYVLVCMGTWWKAEHDLTEQLTIYRSVDSIVEFQIPLNDQSSAQTIPHTTSDGFSYQGHYYSVVSLEIRNDILYIAGLESKPHSFWPNDLLAFLGKHVSTDWQHKAQQLLKFLLKEYSPNARMIFQFLSSDWREAVRIPDPLFMIPASTLPIHSPPPKVA